MPRLRATPEDFRVEEIRLYPASGSGTHTFVEIEKRLRTSDEVARELARAAGVQPRDVGYAGRKDRDAVTRQWFSVPGLDPQRALELQLEGARVVQAERHPHKLRTGQLRGNRFEIVVRDVDEASCDRAEQALAQRVQSGMPNRFGAQRFGRDGRNAALGLALLRGERIGRDRRDARFALSALQAAVFNEALRLRSLPLDALEQGDVAVVHASGGLFLVEDLGREAPRAHAFEVSASGPIFGTRTLEPVGAPAVRERAALAACGIDPEAALCPPRGIRLRGGRRALRIRPEEASLERGPGWLRLRFVLPAGSFASVLLDEILAGAGENLDDARGGQALP